MKPQTGNITIIISAELETLETLENAQRTIGLRRNLGTRLGNGQLDLVASCRGAYKGTPEKSFAFTAPYCTALHVGRELAEFFNQESFLSITADGRGELHHTAGEDGQPGDQEHIGTYTVIHDRIAHDAWTEILATGETFTFE